MFRHEITLLSVRGEQRNCAAETVPACRPGNVEFELQAITSLSAFPKSGVTYLSFLLFYSLFSDDSDIRDLERKYILDIHEYPNATFGDPRAPRLIKSHFPYNPSIPAVRLTSKAIYLIRHPIDVM